ncbi:MAG: N-acetyltransferase [Pseudomonadota bacterium]
MTAHDHDIEAYGTAEQQALLRRGRAVFDLVGADPRFGYYGRGVGILRDGDAPVRTLVRLVQAQGTSNYGSVPTDRVDRLRAEVEASGVRATLYRRWSGGAEALAAARAIVREVPVPPHLHLARIDGDSPPDTMRALVGAAASAGVLTLAGDVLRGTGRPGVTFALSDAAGRVVSCAASTLYAETEQGREFWWGMLATRPEARGARLSLALGARAMLEANAQYGAARFFTGVQDGNAPSEAVCTRVGLTAEEAWVLSVVDPRALSGASLTR